MLSPVELERLAETWRDSDPSDTLQNDVDYLVALGCEYVLVTCMPADAGKSGTGEGKLLANTLFGEDGVVRHDVWRHLPGIFNGAGSTLSAAATALLALDQGGGDVDNDVQQAVVAAQEYTAGALTHARRFGMGKLVPNRLFKVGI